MTIRYTMAVDSDGESNVTILSQGQTTTISGDHPYFTQIVNALLEDDPDELAFFLNPEPDDFIDKALTGAPGFVRQDDEVLYGGEAAPAPVVQTLQRYGAEGRDAATIAKFMDRLAWNPNPLCRAALMTWLDHQGLNLNEDGMIVAFKGVYSTDEPGAYRSSTRGHVFVDGVEYGGDSEDSYQEIPKQRVGSVVTMAREECDTGSVSCSTGLHIGTYQYAHGFADVLLEVLVDPVDVVSIPSGNETWKVRCCKYVVLAVHDPRKGNDLTEHEPDSTVATPEEVVEQLAPALPVTFRGRLWKRLTGHGPEEGQ